MKVSQMVNRRGGRYFVMCSKCGHEEEITASIAQIVKVKEAMR
jgi:hypothetical protein